MTKSEEENSLESWPTERLAGPSWRREGRKQQELPRTLLGNCDSNLLSQPFLVNSDNLKKISNPRISSRLFEPSACDRIEVRGSIGQWIGEPFNLAQSCEYHVWDSWTPPDAQTILLLRCPPKYQSIGWSLAEPWFGNALVWLRCGSKA